MGFLISMLYGVYKYRRHNGKWERSVVFKDLNLLNIGELLENTKGYIILLQPET